MCLGVLHHKLPVLNMCIHYQFPLILYFSFLLFNGGDLEYVLLCLCCVEIRSDCIRIECPELYPQCSTHSVGRIVKFGDKNKMNSLKRDVKHMSHKMRDYMDFFFSQNKHYCRSMKELFTALLVVSSYCLLIYTCA